MCLRVRLALVQEWI